MFDLLVTWYFLAGVSNLLLVTIPSVCVVNGVCVFTFSTCCCSCWLAGGSWTIFLGVPISSSASAPRNTRSSKSPTVSTYSSYSLFMALLQTHTNGSTFLKQKEEGRAQAVFCSLVAHLLSMKFWGSKSSVKSSSWPFRIWLVRNVR